MIALILVILAQSTPGWSHIETRNWVYRDHSADGSTLMYTQPGIGSRIWVRFEYNSPRSTRGGSRSARELIEADCAGGRSRIIQWSDFSRPNLEGERITMESVPVSNDWTFPAPGTLGKNAFDLICAVK